MIGGMLKAKTLAERICPAAPKVRPMAAKTLSCASVRSAKGFIRATMKAELDCAPPSIRLKPTIARLFSIEGMDCRMPSTCSTTARVRATEAPWGSWICTKKAPWSSAGRKPCGVRFATVKIPKAMPAVSSSERSETRTSRRTTAA
jgi:hypothetical protein